MERDSKGRFVKGTNIKDLTGQKFGKLTVICLDEERTKRKAYWICECDCTKGKRKSIRGDTLKIVRSCGCLKKEQDIINLGIENYHGMTNHPAFSIWNSMINRCNNPKNTHYKDYGGRGITVCEEWKDVKKFCSWADENGYEKGLSIERINVNGDYEPSNCEWIPRNEQTWNTRKTIYIEINGEKIPLAKTARELGISPCLAWHRWKKGEREYGRIFFKGRFQNQHKG